MKSINIRTMDLNLLRLLVVLADTKSVSEAASQLSLSQPATSNALSRLRIALEDPLFVRTRKGMEPTPFVERILPGIKQHLNGLFETLAADASFNPETSRRLFRLSMSGLGEAMFLSVLIAHLARVAPDVRLENLQIPAENLVEAFEKNTIDLAIGMINLSGRGLGNQALFRDDFVAIASPLLNTPLENLTELKKQRLVVAAPSASFALDIVRRMSQLDLSKSIAIRTASFAGFAQILASAPVVAILPRQFALQLQLAGMGSIAPVPLTHTESTATMLWSEKAQNDQGVKWLRETTAGLFSKDPQSDETFPIHHAR